MSESNPNNLYQPFPTNSLQPLGPNNYGTGNPIQYNNIAPNFIQLNHPQNQMPNRPKQYKMNIFQLTFKHKNKFPSSEIQSFQNFISTRKSIQRGFDYLFYTYVIYGLFASYRTRWFHLTSNRYLMRAIAIKLLPASILSYQILKRSTKFFQENKEIYKQLMSPQNLLHDLIESK